ncbi:Metallo-hydrolase/oxidoreductase superfamily protein [Striga hermonthica]|uniref:Metallo-hydrolase/oxidoreductase superfamily protein n=1 Tax=Striga hermonthica TaxID=68872 RepID=A0A9N7MWJ0_STRHE|nr:Metallo-hydrolase/oxidoreductase superfamily protein [Striga hermonthica]
MVVPFAYGVVRPVSAPWIRLSRCSANPFLPCRKGSFSVSRNGPYRWKSTLQASLHSSSVSVSNGAIDQSEIIFIGTGTSEGIPRVSCLTNPNKTCPVCIKATEPGNKNRRLNTSILVRFQRPSGMCNILIDAGKFFYHSALKWFPAYGIRTIDAVIITHSHADAIGGLDDLRDWTNNVQPSVPIYTAQRDFEVMKKTHYYLVDTSGVTPGAAVSALQFNIIQEEPFLVHDLQFTPLPVWHGRGYRSLGFRFGNICYIRSIFINSLWTSKGFGGSSKNPTKKNTVHRYDAFDGS